MGHKMLKIMIKDAFLEVLSEQQEKRNKKTKSVDKLIDTGAAMGRGRFKSSITKAASRADTDPESLMRDLGIDVTAKGEDDLTRVQNVLEQAISRNNTMSEAFKAPKMVEDKKSGVKKLEVQNDDTVPNRDAVKYLSLTLRGAANAGLLSLNRGVKFEHYALVKMPTIRAK